MSKDNEEFPVWRPADLKIYVTRPELLPTKGHDSDSGWDLRANIFNSMWLNPYDKLFVPTGVYMAVKPGWELQIRPRSGLAKNHGIFTVFGTIDSGYRGEIGITLINTSGKGYIVNDLDRIAQFVVCPVNLDLMQVVDSVEALGPSERGAKGYGSTGR